MLKRCGVLATFAALALALQAQVSQAVTIAQIDDFQNGTTMGWTVGSGSNPNPPANVADVAPVVPVTTRSSSLQPAQRGPGASSCPSILSSGRAITRAQASLPCPWL